jgi:hypothetical protein
MKKLFFSIFFAAGFVFLNQAVAQSHFSTKIGELVNGVPTITYNQSQLMQKWQSHLAFNSGVLVTFSTVQIVHENYGYILRGSNSVGNIKVAVELVLVGNDLFQVMAMGAGTTVTCTGCMTGCHPMKLIDQGWACAPQCPEYDSCVKTETVSELSILDSNKN